MINRVSTLLTEIMTSVTWEHTKVYKENYYWWGIIAGASGVTYIAPEVCSAAMETGSYMCCHMFIRVISVKKNSNFAHA